MQIIRDTSAITPEPCVATIGFFDGVHAGHRYLIQQVKEIAAAKGLRSALVTFPVHPRKVMNVEYRPELLTTPEEKISLLADIGVDYCLMLDFTPSLDNIFFRISHIVQSDVYRILIVTEINHSFRTTLNRLGGGRNIIQHSGRIAIIVSDSDSRFKVIFITRTTIHFPTAFTYTTVGTGMDIPLKVIQILLMQQFFT